MPRKGTGPRALHVFCCFACLYSLDAYLCASQLLEEPYFLCFSGGERFSQGLQQQGKSDVCSAHHNHPCHKAMQESSAHLYTMNQSSSSSILLHPFSFCVSMHRLSSPFRVRVVPVCLLSCFLFHRCFFSNGVLRSSRPSVEKKKQQRVESFGTFPAPSLYILPPRLCMYMDLAKPFSSSTSVIAWACACVEGRRSKCASKNGARRPKARGAHALFPSSSSSPLPAPYPTHTKDSKAKAHPCPLSCTARTQRGQDRRPGAVTTMGLPRRSSFL